MYAASKAAVRSFSRTWANELSGRAIRVNTLVPGPIVTPGITAWLPDADQAAADEGRLRQRGIFRWAAWGTRTRPLLPHCSSPAMRAASSLDPSFSWMADSTRSDRRKRMRCACPGEDVSRPCPRRDHTGSHTEPSLDLA